jgi:hypothetical protein
MPSDRKSVFKRPEQSGSPVLGPEAERFVHGPTQSPAPDQAAPVAEPEPPRGVEQVEEAPATRLDEPKAERMKRLTIDIPASLHKRVKEQCATRETTIAEVVRKYLEKSFPDPERRKSS